MGFKCKMAQGLPHHPPSWFQFAPPVRLRNFSSAKMCNFPSRRTLDLVNEHCRCRKPWAGKSLRSRSHSYSLDPKLKLWKQPPENSGCLYVSVSEWHGKTHARTFLKVNKIRHDYVCAGGHKINWLPTNPVEHVEQPSLGFQLGFYEDIWMYICTQTEDNG